METTTAPSPPTILRTTQAGETLPEERAAIEVYELGPELARRQTARLAVGGKRAGYVHVDAYPAGSGAPAKGTLAFVAGLSGHVLMYAGFLDALSRAGWNVVGVDMRGHGRSSGRRGDFTMGDTLVDIRAALTYGHACWGGPLGMVGSSLGGYYALAAANALPEIEAACCHWVMLPEMPVTDKDRRMRPIARVLAKVAPRMRMSTLKIANWDGVSEDPATRQKLFDDPLMAWKYSMRGLASGVTYNPTPPLTELRCPVQIVIGEADTMTPLTYTREAVSRLHGADKELVIIPGAGHMGGLIEHRAEVVDAMDRWLAGHLAEQKVGAASS